MKLVSVDALLEQAQCTNAYFQVKSIVTDLPKIDAEPVVRCKDCKHHYMHEGRIMCNIFCNLFAVAENHYCSYGVKMDEEKKK